MSNFLEDNLPEKPITFNVVELDVSDIWGCQRPCDGVDWIGQEAKDETRSYVELAGGQILAWFIVDPRLVSGELTYKPKPGYTPEIPFDGEVPLWLIGHLPKNPVLDDPENFLGAAIHMEGCEGYGYVPLSKSREEVGKLRIVRTIEALDPSEAEYEVREEHNKKNDVHFLWG
jgi:hypothetical protein